MADIFKILFSKDIAFSEDKHSLVRARTVVSSILAVVALFMLIMNLKNNSSMMAYSSIVLVVGFSLSAVVAGVFKKANISAIIIACLVGFVLSVFALTGGNEGFAILWILLVPMFSISLLGIVPGLILSTYFLVFIMALFWTPLRSIISGMYTANFSSRFPVLYLADYAVATFFSLQREYLQNRLNYEAYTDGLTGLYNRRMFMKTLRELEDSHQYSVIMVDLNGLKIVNDSKGHEAGDIFIMKAALLCQEAFKRIGVACRIGGDEIAIIAKGNKADIEARISELNKEADKCKDTMDFDFSFSIGYVHSSDHKGVSAEELFKMADAYMYQNKMAYYADNTHNRRKYPRMEVNACGAFSIMTTQKGFDAFVGRISDVSEKGIKVEAASKEYEKYLENLSEGMFLNFQATDQCEVDGITTMRVFDGQAEIVRKCTEGENTVLGCRIDTGSESFEKYVTERKMSILISKVDD